MDFIQTMSEPRKWSFCDQHKLEEVVAGLRTCFPGVTFLESENSLTYTPSDSLKYDLVVLSFLYHNGGHIVNPS